MVYFICKCLEAFRLNNSNNNDIWIIIRQPMLQNGSRINEYE